MSAPETPAPLGERRSRRSFVRALLAGGAALAGWAALLHLARGRPGGERAPGAAGPSPLDATQRATLAAAQALVLPSEAGAPGARELSAIDYLEGALADPRVEPDDVEALLACAGRLEAAAQEGRRAAFAALPPEEQERLLRALQDDEEGAELLGVLIVFTLEALVSDPVYGGNRDGAGWRWLGLSPPQPQPRARWTLTAIGRGGRA